MWAPHRLAPSGTHATLSKSRKHFSSSDASRPSPCNLGWSNHFPKLPIGFSRERSSRPSSWTHYARSPAYCRWTQRPSHPESFIERGRRSPPSAREDQDASRPVPFWSPETHALVPSPSGGSIATYLHRLGTSQERKPPRNYASRRLQRHGNIRIRPRLPHHHQDR